MQSRTEAFADAPLQPLPEEQEQQEELRRQYADEFLSAPAPVGKVSRILLRLPTGERLERTFSADAPLSRVYAWATCCALLPEARGRALSVPTQFEFATSFPAQKFGVDKAEMTLSELGLSPSATLLLVDKNA